MGEIRQLDPHVADLIAAGEVVERPASVVKELAENAMDAGASQLTVEIAHGGMSLIRVTDNGSGIPSGQLQTAFLRHATSKIRGARDLEAIGSLGFRGEALAAIAAVSRIELLSRSAGEEFGASLQIEGGVVRAQQQAGCPIGTTMLVRDLFFNTPARQKYMKRDAAEGSAVFAQMQRLALSRPDVSMKFLRDGKQEFLTPGDGKAMSALYSILGRELALGFTELKGENPAGSISGFVSMPVCCRGSRSLQYFIVNGRSIRSRLLTAALEEAYRNQKMVGKFPGCLLYIETKHSTVDVNVHPSKMEVKFLHEKQIFDLLYQSVLSALGGEKTAPELRLPEESRPAPPRSAGFQSMTAAQFRDSMGASPAALFPPLRVRETEAAKDARLLPDAPQMEIPLKRAPAQDLPLPPDKGAQESPPAQTAKSEAPPEGAESGECALPWRLVGELFRTYILVEQGEDVCIIDKHAAHERIHFDRLRAEGFRPMAQNLMEPRLLSLSPPETQALRAQLPLLEGFGFLLEEFGGETLLLRAVPADLDGGAAEGLLAELAETLLENKRGQLSDLRDHLMAGIACKAALKGGQRNAPEELLALAEAVLSGRVKYCPHGRPVAMRLPRAQLERQFGRG